MTVATHKNMYFVYVDESYDETYFAYCAVFIDAFRWNTHLNDLNQWRQEWFHKYNIPLDYELHATDFVGGRGRYPDSRDKNYRGKLFYEAIGRIEKMKNVTVMNAITDNKINHLTLFEFMLTRINNTLKKRNALGVLICDEGNEKKLTSMVRRMKKENLVPSDYQHRKQGKTERNLPLHHIIEDPLFKTSKSSYFIQLADFLAFALLRNEHPLPSTLHIVSGAFDQLDKSLLKVFRKDKRKKGIIRI